MIFNEKNSSSSNDYLNEISLEITLVFSGKNLNKNEITTLIKSAPTSAWNAYEILEISNLKKLKIADNGKWYLKSNNYSNKLEVALNSFLMGLTQDLAVWKYLSEKHDAYIEVTGYQNVWNNNYSFSFKTLKLLTDRSLSLNIDVYNLEICSSE